MADHSGQKRADELFVDEEVRSGEQAQTGDFGPLKRKLKSRHLQMIAIGGKDLYILRSIARY